MNPSLSIEAEFKGGKLNAGIERAVQAEEKLDERTKAIARSAKQAEAELTRFAKRTTELNSTPLERYAAQVKKLDEALAKDKLTQDTYNRALAYQQQKLSEATEAADDYAGRMALVSAAEREHAAELARVAQWQARVKANSLKLEYEQNLAAVRANNAALADEKTKLQAVADWRARVKANSLKLEYDQNLRAIREQNKALEENKRAQQQASGPSVVGELKSVAAGYLSVAAGVGLLTQGLQAADAKGARALTTMRALTDLRIQLNQVGGEQLEKDAEYAATRFGLNRREAYSFYRDANNLGFAKDADYIASRRWGIGDITKVGDVAGTVPQLFDGQITPLQAINMAGVAAEPSKLDVQGISPIIAKFAGGAKEIGTSPDEAFAWASLMVQKYGTPGEAGTAAQEFQGAMSVRGLDAKGGTLGAIKALQGMKKEDRDAILKEDKSIRLFYGKAQEAMGDLPERQKQIAAAREASGTSEDWISRMDRKNRLNPKIAADAMLTKAESIEELTNENRNAASRSKIEAAEKNTLAWLDGNGVSPLAWVMGQAGSFSARMLGGGEAAVSGSAIAGATGHRVVPGVLSGGLTELGPLLTRLFTTLTSSAEESKAAAKAQKEAAELQREAAKGIRDALTGGRGRAVAAAARVPAT